MFKSVQKNGVVETKTGPWKGRKRKMGRRKRGKGSQKGERLSLATQATHMG